MPKTLTGNKEQKIPIGDTEDCYLLVNFDWEVIKHPKRKEDFHGQHEFNEDEVNYSIQSIHVNLCGTDFPSLNLFNLSEQQLSAIENLLSIED